MLADAAGGLDLHGLFADDFHVDDVMPELTRKQQGMIDLLDELLSFVKMDGEEANAAFVFMATR